MAPKNLLGRVGVLAVLLPLMPWICLLVDGEASAQSSGTITFGTVGLLHFAFDVFAVTLPDGWREGGKLLQEGLKDSEVRLTDGVSVNYNGQFVESSEHEGESEEGAIGGEKLRSPGLIFVSEREGASRIYVNGPDGKSTISQIPCSTPDSDDHSMCDKPTIRGKTLVFVSTANASTAPTDSSAAVYSTSLDTGTTIRLTPPGVADFSPAISPSGEWIMVASTQGVPKHEPKDFEEIETALYVYGSKDGSQRQLVAKSGGWATWANERSVYYHRKAEDGWWSIFLVDLPSAAGELREPLRITPPGVHCFTPSVSATGEWLAVATRRRRYKSKSEKSARHIEIFDLRSQKFSPLTVLMSPDVSHYNPFISSSGLIGYHRCRGKEYDGTVPVIQTVPLPQRTLAKFNLSIDLLRVDGTFPIISPDGTHLAFIRESGDGSVPVPVSRKGVYVLRLSDFQIWKVYGGRAYGLAWDPVTAGVLYSSDGQCFQGAGVATRLISISNVLHSDKVYSRIAYPIRRLTEDGTGNNGMPSQHPSKSELVFVSGRSGHKNLYKLSLKADGTPDRTERLTAGNWTDHHPHWSPSGEWIVFISNRAYPTTESFDVYMVRPDGTGLHSVTEILDRPVGVSAHPRFSPDGKKLVLSSNLAGFSSETISMPLQYQPHGEIFVVDVDPVSQSTVNYRNYRRLTHNSYEDGTASWSPVKIQLPPVSELANSSEPLRCNFLDYLNTTDNWPDLSPRAMSSQIIHSCGHSSPIPALASTGLNLANLMDD